MPNDQEAEDLRSKLLRLAREAAQGKVQDYGELTGADIATLLHEFGVYQSELEAQNEELRQAKAQLEDARSSYVDLYDFAPVGYLTLDAAGLIQQVNLTACSLLGADRGRLFKAPFARYLTPDSADAFHLHLQKVIATRGRASCELRLRLAGGREIDVQAESMAVISPQGPPLCRMAISDVTERKLLDSSIKAKEVAEHTARIKSDFLANMSHEIRTPLSGVIGLAEMLASGDMDEKQRDILGRLRSSARLLLGIINDILDISRIDAGRLALAPEVFRLPDVLELLKGLFEHAAAAKGLRLWFDVTSNVPAALYGDAFRLNQVLSNLVSNAIKFTPAGEIAVLVQRAPEDMPGTVLFIVRDTGIGIPAGKTDQLFCQFNQLDDSYTKRYGGTGLGLYICKQLVGMMGGTIWAESLEGGGSSFFFTVDFPGREVASEPPRESAPAEPPAGRRLDILLAEDSRVNQLVISFYLDRAGHAVEVVENGHDALAALARRRFDAVLMDGQMPDMDGRQVARAIRGGGEPWADVPIIALTAYAMVGDRERFLASGMDDYLAKPVDALELEAKLQSVVARKAQGAPVNQA
jgi:PAS domain S-box-containing protein